ncbi:MAG: hypothetical protein SVX43_21860 [Cyanobacteriota bacterium]|nr:hypothetical protein [Cyanobacteriota bacterium]
MSNQIAMTEDERETVKHNHIARRYRVPVTNELVKKDDNGWYPQLQLHYYTGIGKEFLEDTSWRGFARGSKNGAVFEPDFAQNKLWAKVRLRSYALSVWRI